MRGFLIGRFQPFHHGHQSVVDEIATEVDELVVGIGSAGTSHTSSDPFTAGERIMMISRALEDIDVRTYVVPIEDLERHSVWVSHVRSMCPHFDVAYSNNPLVIQLFDEAGVDVRQSPMYNRDVLEGSGIRERMITDEPWRDRVPDPVVDVIDEIDGVQRIRRVSKSDGTDGKQ